MATSGTVGQTVIDVTTVIEHAARRCGVLSTSLTAEQQISAKENLFLILSDLANRGVSLWCVSKQVLGLYENQAIVNLAIGTVDVLNANYRTTDRPTGTALSSAGTAANAFDADLATSCAAGAGGYIGLDYGTATAIFTVGLYVATAASLNPVVETSSDGVTWTTILALGSFSASANTWYWFDINNSTSAQYWRVRETGTAVLTLDELVFGNNPLEITMSALSRDNYTNLPNKDFASNRVLEYWFDKQAVNPRVWLWPTPNSVYDQLVFWCQRQIQDVGSLTNTLDVPQRWLESIIFLLAHRVSLELPFKTLAPGRTEYLEAQAMKHLAQAEDGETDGAPITWAPRIGVYTR